MHSRKLYMALMAMWLFVTSWACTGQDQSGKSAAHYLPESKEIGDRCYTMGGATSPLSLS
jgi:hypothetical protein